MLMDYVLLCVYIYRLIVKLSSNAILRLLCNDIPHVHVSVLTKAYKNMYKNVTKKNIQTLQT
jgi:hypothetical protein